MSKLYSLLSSLSSGGAVALLALAMFSAPSNLYAVDPGGEPENCYSTDQGEVCIGMCNSICSNLCSRATPVAACGGRCAGDLCHWGCSCKNVVGPCFVCS